MSETDGLPAPQRRWVMGCALLGVVLAGLDSAIANVILMTAGQRGRSGAASGMVAVARTMGWLLGAAW